MARVIQSNFARGEIGPALYGRVATEMYRTALRTARNAVVHTSGGVSQRPGSKFIGPVKTHSETPRLKRFEFKTTDQYILEFGDQYMRVIRDDGYVLDGTVTDAIEAATQANPVTLTMTGHPFSDGQEVYITGVVGMTELNGRHFVVANSTANTLELTSQIDGTNIDGTGYGAWSSGGTVSKVYEISTPYVLADVFELTFAQSADVMTIAHKDYAIRELSRLDHDDWSLTTPTFAPEITWPTNVAVTVNGTPGTETERYRVTAVSEANGEESLPGLDGTAKSITGATAANPVVITSAAHGFLDGDEVYISGVVGMTEINGRRFIVAGKTTNTYELQGEDGSGHTAYTSGGTAELTFTRITTGAATADNTISWGAVAGADRYAVYKYSNGIYGLIGETEALVFTDDNIAPDESISHPRLRNPFSDTGEYPAAVGFYAQRRCFGGSINDPDTTHYSQTSAYSNFNVSVPLQAGDAMQVVLAAAQINEIRHFVGLNDLLVFTSGAEWLVNSGDNSGFSIDTISQKPQSYWGCSHRPPVVVGNTVLYLDGSDARVRSLGYSFQAGGYVGIDMSLLSRHLFDGHNISDWALTQSPDSRAHLVRDDGKMLTLTFEQDQEVIAWTHWDTDGKFRAVETLKRGGTYDEDSIYAVVQRTIEGNTVRYVEVFRQTYFEAVEDCYFVDSGLSLDAPLAIESLTLANPVVVTITAHGLSNGDEVDIEGITWVPDAADAYFNSDQPDQMNGYRYTVANVTANTFELSGLDGSAFNAYVEGGNVRKAELTLGGLWHLEGETISALADGNVVSNLSVSDGTITLARKASRVHAGVNFITDVELLDIEAPEGTIQGAFKKIPSVVVRFERSRGMFVGPDKDNLVEMKQREFEKMGQPTQLLTGDKKITLKPSWNSHGRLLMRQPYPLPMTILAAVPDIYVGDDPE